MNPVMPSGANSRPPEFVTAFPKLAARAKSTAKLKKKGGE
jgi:hypothetical protein